MAGIRPPPGLPPPGLCWWDQRPIVGGLRADAEPFAPLLLGALGFGGFRADAEPFAPPLLAACISAGAAAALQAAAFPFCDMAAAACAIQLQAELEAMVVALQQDLTLADVEPKLARAAEAARGAGFRECETLCYDALMAACCRDSADGGLGFRINASDEVGRRLIAAFGRDFSPGSAGEDLQLWSRVVGARYHVYGGGERFHQLVRRRRLSRRRRADAVAVETVRMMSLAGVVGDAVAWETEMVGAEDDLPRARVLNLCRLAPCLPLSRGSLTSHVYTN